MNEETNQLQPQKIYLTVNQTCEKYSWMTHAGLRSLIFYAESNGFKECVFRLGRKILISEEKLLEWVEKHKS